MLVEVMDQAEVSLQVQLQRALQVLSPTIPSIVRVISLWKFLTAISV
jgi:hypothetical protein